jgi:hypothetical protein
MEEAPDTTIAAVRDFIDGKPLKQLKSP